MLSSIPILFKECYLFLFLLSIFKTLLLIFVYFFYFFRMDIQNIKIIQFLSQSMLGVISQPNKFKYNNQDNINNMCFLKASTIKEPQNHPSAFKKYDYENQSLNSEEIYEDLKANSEGAKKLNEQSQTTQNYSHQQDEYIYFQFSMLMELMNYNNAITLNLLEKNQIMEDNINVLDQLLDDLKNSKKKKSQKKIANPIEMDPDNLGDKLIQKLFGTQNYRYQLVLDEPFDMKLYKQRNFDLNLKLVDSENNIILNSNSIPLSFSIYSSDIQPVLITENKCGQTILKGNSQSEIYHGLTSFKKIHIREVTSYYNNGWVYIIVYPKSPSFKYNNRESSLEEVIDYGQIKPLVFTDVIVRAKKK